MTVRRTEEESGMISSDVETSREGAEALAIIEHPKERDTGRSARVEVAREKDEGIPGCTCAKKCE